MAAGPSTSRTCSGGRPRASRLAGSDVQANVTISLEDAYNGARKTFGFEVEEPCATCHGAGHVGGKPCATCHGGGWEQRRQDVDVKIPAGVRTGQKVRVAGEGGRGAGARGDLYLIVTVAPHPQLERKGDDLHVTLPDHRARGRAGDVGRRADPARARSR